MKYTTTAILLIATSLSFAQFSPRNDEDANYVEIESEYKEYDAVIIRDSRTIRYLTMEPKRKVTNYKHVHIQTETGLERWNKFVVRVDADASLDRVMVRVIKPDGTKTDMGLDDMKTVEEFEAQDDLKVLAIKGVEVGDQIETYYIKTEPAYLVSVQRFSDEYPILYAYYKATAPDQVKLNSRTYNGDAEEMGLHEYRFQDLMPIKEEIYSNPARNQVQVVHTVTKVGSQFTILGSYDRFKPVIMEQYFEGTQDMAPKVGKYLSKAGLNPDSKGLAAAKSVDSIIRARFTFKDEYGTEFSDVKTILKTGLANEVGLTKLYISAMRAIGEDFELLVGPNRYRGELDPHIVSFHTLTEYCIYLPKVSEEAGMDIYIVPSDVTSHLGPPNDLMVGSRAWALRKDGSTRFTQVDAWPMELTRQVRDMDLAFTNDLQKVNIHQSTTTTGYYSISANLVVMVADDEEEQQKLLKETIKYQLEDAEVEKVEIDQAWGHVGNCPTPACPRVLTADFSTSEIIERAGDNILLHIGKIIGPQAEMYEEKQRVMPMELNYPHWYSYDIRMKVPQGYRYAGIENGEISNVCMNDQDSLASFISTVQVEGDEIVIVIEEKYHVIHVDLGLYQPFRKVINSAADFNKAVILFEPISKEEAEDR